MMEYLVVQERSLEELEASVREFIRLGWEPQGGVATSITYQTGGLLAFYTQAMIRVNDDD